MNGGVMDHQDPAFHSRQVKTSGQHCPEYHLQMNHSCQQNCLHQHSKAMNYQLFSDLSKVDGLPQHLPNRSTHRLNYNYTDSSCSLDPRSKITYSLRREPLELPVPEFEINDEYVAESDVLQHNRKQKTKELDLDTRIDLLIKSKALSCMHPIFSELDESTSDSDNPFLREIQSTDTFKSPTDDGVLSPKNEVRSKSCDNCEEPLSRPPSPFLSRATYLFWFNKAIELKLHAKAQEKALLEKAAKRLIQEQVLPSKISKTGSYQEGNDMIKHLLNEVGKEFKEVVKQEFINEVLETTIISTFENWWVEEQLQEIKKKPTFDKSNNGLESTEDLTSVGPKELDLPKENTCNYLCLNSNESGTDVNKSDPLKVGKNHKVSFINNSAEENVLDSISNPNNKELLISPFVQSGKEFIGTTQLDSLSINVCHSNDNISKTDTDCQYTTSYQISKNHLPDKNQNKTSKVPGKHDTETVKNVLNLIVDNVDRLTEYQLQNAVEASEEINL